MTQIPSPTWFVGCGNMGRAVLDGWRAAGIDLSPVTVIRPSGAAVDAVRVVTSFDQAGQAPRMVVLAVKPHMLDEVAEELRSAIAEDTVVVSLLVGVEAASVRARFPHADAVIRALPNLPVAIRRGVVALYSEDAGDEARQQVGDLFALLGYAIWTADEARLSAIASVAGAGPAYVARFVAALAKAAEKKGLSRDTAATVALETVLGTAWMAATTGEDMDSVARRVASPRGTTEAGLAVLDRDHVLDELVGVAIEAAARRGAELAEEARAASLAEDARLS